MDEQSNIISSEPAVGGTAPAPYTDRLRAVQELPVCEHADAYQALHCDLQAALAEIDAR